MSKNFTGTMESITRLLKTNDFFIKKKFGQNFITDQNVLKGIVDAADIEDCDVIEIGPGLGSLTVHILEKAHSLVSYEIDNDLIPILTDLFKDYDNFTLVNQDILSVNIDEEIKSHFDGKHKICLVANLPYYITTPIILKLLSETDKIRSYTMMMQEEVADRICSKPSVKDYNSLSVCIQYRAHASKVLRISRNIFIPRPNVDSAVIRLDLYDESPYKTKYEEYFFKLIRDAFCQRRKTLVNNLKQTGYDKERVLAFLHENNFNDAVRSEQLSVQDFVKLTEFLQEA
ncbi:MAG: 16S rRNA (adenine(1518)-N(6)/adenine(1519)-N(6))-dimethyltransferase RsmA [Acholeplasmatales bacterium]|nr:16S rRNA (adenine(1518)-N(6)/adenine(1519)-N(6))-dimethyltransferase RsmA [Acholeplasmatales bacterium]